MGCSSSIIVLAVDSSSFTLWLEANLIASSTMHQ